MADILCQLREEATQALLENGTAGAGGLETRELGYATTEQEFSFRLDAGGFARIASKARLARADSALNAGGALVGYFPSNGMSATNMQAAIDELRASVAGIGSVGGAGVANRVAFWSTSTTLDDVAFLDIVGTKLQFGADSLATLYRSAPGELSTDGHFVALGNLFGDTLFASVGVQTDGSLSADRDSLFGNDFLYDNATSDEFGVARLVGSLTKNNSTLRTFYGLKLNPTFNAGGSNANTTFHVLDMDTVNTGLTGLTVRLLRIAFGGSQRLLLTSGGQLVLDGGGGMDVDGTVQLNNDVFARTHLTVGSDLTESAPSAGLGSHNFYGIYNRNSAGALRSSHVRLLATLNAGGSNLSQTLDVLSVETLNTSATGMAVNLIRALYGAAELFKVSALDGMYYMGASGGKSALGIGLNNPETTLHITHLGGSAADQHAAFSMQYSVDNPPDPASTTQARFYLKGGLFVIQYNDGGTVRYKSLDLTGTGSTWAHSTTPP
jgi:hypothetical protein